MRKTRGALLATLVLFGGCGLINALDKVKGVTFKLPAQMYSVSTSDSRWRQPPPGGIPAVPCGAGNPVASCCTTATDCPLSCEDQSCALKFKYEDVQKIDLSKDEQLGAYKGMIFSQVLLKELDLDINNTLNVSTPPVELYVAPANITDSTKAQRIATIPAQPPGSHMMVTVPLDEASQQVFSNFARDFQTPFNLILSTTILVKSGQPTPQGRIDFTVGGTVEAKL
jgi:hypothetical protein